MSRAVAGLFVASLLGLLAVVGLAAAAVSPVALVPYAVVVVALLVALVRRARAVVRSRQQPTGDGRTCTCCTSTVFDPVEVR
jgi:hypothetical protein